MQMENASKDFQDRAEATPALVDPYTRIAMDVLLQAAGELVSPDPTKRWWSLLWFAASPMSRFYFDFCGIEADPLDWLRRPGWARVLRRKVKKIRSVKNGQ